MTVLRPITSGQALRLFSLGMRTLEEFEAAANGSGVNVRGKIADLGRMAYVTAGDAKGDFYKISVRHPRGVCDAVVNHGVQTDPLMRTRGLHKGDIVEFFCPHVDAQALHRHVPGMENLPQITQLNLAIPHEFIQPSVSQKLFAGRIAGISDRAQSAQCRITIEDETGARGTFTRLQGYKHVEAKTGQTVVIAALGPNILTMKPYAALAV